MSIDSLPYMVFLLVTEFATGTLLATCALHARGLVTRGFLKMGAATALAGAALALWLALSLYRSTDVAGYAIDVGLLNPARVALAAFLAVVAAYTYAVWRECTREERP